MEFFSYLIYILITWLICWIYKVSQQASIQQKAQSIILEAERVAREEQESKKTELRQMMLAHDAKIQHERSLLEKESNELKQEKKKLKQEEEELKKEIASLERAKKNSAEEKTSLQKERAEVQTELERISKLTFDDARKELWLRLEATCKKEHEKRLLEWQTMYDRECQERALSILFSALERKAQTLTRETFLTEIPLSETLIPRLIGKEGRNIHTLEELLGVFLLIDESEKKLRISSHDLKTRSLAKATIERVLNEGKITPVTIKNAYEAALHSLLKLSEDKGRDACRKLHVQETLPVDILRSLGELSLRSTAGQNALLHSIEVAEMMEIVAKELSLCSEKAKLMGLFHDIGKALSSDWGSSHALAGAKFLDHFGIEKDIVQAVAAHHGETNSASQEARLLPLCDRLSAELPGARQEQEPFFLALVHEYENLAKSVQGVHSAWAHYAGNHIELVIRTDNRDSKNLKTALEQSINSQNPRLPVKISILG